MRPSGIEPDSIRWQRIVLTDILWSLGFYNKIAFLIVIVVDLQISKYFYISQTNKINVAKVKKAKSNL